MTEWFHDIIQSKALQSVTSKESKYCILLQTIRDPHLYASLNYVFTFKRSAKPVWDNIAMSVSCVVKVTLRLCLPPLSSPMDKFSKSHLDTRISSYQTVTSFKLKIYMISLIQKCCIKFISTSNINDEHNHYTKDTSCIILNTVTSNKYLLVQVLSNMDTEIKGVIWFTISKANFIPRQLLK